MNSVAAFLDEHDVSEIEREFLKVSLLSDDEKTAELARNMIIARGQPDKLVQVQEAIENAKKRGAVPADFVIEGELEELSRTAPAVAAGMILESFISFKVTGLPLKQANYIASSINKLFAKIQFSRQGIISIIDLIKHDKKNIKGKNRFTLLSKLLSWMNL